MKLQVIAKILALWMVFALAFPIVAIAQETAGTADVIISEPTTGEVLTIRTATELIAAAAKVAVGTKIASITLMASIEVDDTWTGIGTAENPFTGIFEGNGNTVTLRNPSVGLFGTVASGRISNIGVLGTVRAAAALVSGTATSTNFKGCFNAATVNNTAGNAAGLVNQAKIATLENCYNTGIIKARDKAVGLLIYGESITISSCYSAGWLEGTTKISIAEGTTRDALTECAVWDALPKFEGVATLSLEAMADGSIRNGNSNDWQYSKGLLPRLSKFKNGTGSAISTAVGWLKNNTIVLSSISGSTWYQAGSSLTEGATVTLPATLVVQNGVDSREIYFPGTGSHSVELSAVDANQYLTAVTHKLECKNGYVLSLADGYVWSLSSGTMPDNLQITKQEDGKHNIVGTVNATPGTYIVFLKAEKDNGVFLQETTFQIQKAAPKLAITGEATDDYDGTQKSVSTSRQQGAPEPTLQYYRNMEDSTYALTETLTSGAQKQGDAPCYAGTYQARATLVEDDYFKGEVATFDFSILPIALQSTNFKTDGLQAAMYYTGSPIQKTVETPNGITYVEGKDYTVAYEHNTQASSQEDGKANIILTGIGNYKDDLSYEFTIAIGSVPMTLQKQHGYTLGMNQTKWTLPSENNRTVYEGGSIVYLKDPGSYTFIPYQE